MDAVALAMRHFSILNPSSSLAASGPGRGKRSAKRKIECHGRGCCSLLPQGPLGRNSLYSAQSSASCSASRAMSNHAPQEEPK